MWSAFLLVLSVAHAGVYDHPPLDQLKSIIVVQRADHCSAAMSSEHQKVYLVGKGNYGGPVYRIESTNPQVETVDEKHYTAIDTFQNDVIGFKLLRRVLESLRDPSIELEVIQQLNSPTPKVMRFKPVLGQNVDIIYSRLKASGQNDLANALAIYLQRQLVRLKEAIYGLSEMLLVNHGLKIHSLKIETEPSGLSSLSGVFYFVTRDGRFIRDGDGNRRRSDLYIHPENIVIDKNQGIPVIVDPF